MDKSGFKRAGVSIGVNFAGIVVPDGFAHSFVVLFEVVEIIQAVNVVFVAVPLHGFLVLGNLDFLGTGSC